MNLVPLFETQKVLRDRIGYNEPDRFNKLILALLVELGECANEWRGFKFWSKDQEPRVNVPLYVDSRGLNKVVQRKNLLLEEYVDGLHFVLELGLEKGFDDAEFPYLHEHNFDIYTEKDTTDQFTATFSAISEFLINEDLETYEEMFLYFIGLSKHFKFTWEQIEQAYMEKNKINHERQENGY